MARLWWCWLAPASAAIATVVVAAPDAKPPPAVFDDRSALDPFAAALAAQRGGSADHPLRIAYFGDSLTADDQITGGLRDRFQQLLGDGGPGYVFAVAPHPYNQHHAVVRWASANWRVWGISTAVPQDRLLGLGGSAETDDDGVIALTPASACSAVEVAYLMQPHGGSFDVVADKQVVATIATAGDAKAPGFSRVVLPDGTKRIAVRAHGRVRLFGATLEAARGAVVDNLGVVNATAKALATNDLGTHLRDELAHRDADLAVVMLGTNEAEWLVPRGAGMAEHEKLFGELLANVRAATPKGSCLVVSPFDQLDWRAEDLAPRASIPAMVEAQRRAAHANGCAFWDAYAWMGGRGASREWYRRGWVVKDFQHPTSEGATRIAEALFLGLTEPASSSSQ